MIRFNLTCAQGHDFESWFQSGAAFDTLQAAGLIACVRCGGTEVRKSLMAPALGGGAAAPDAPRQMPPPMPGQTPGQAGPLTGAPADARAAALAELRRRVEEQSEYVGMGFAREARAMHEGEAPVRSIHGEARIEDAKRLIEDGVPVAPLPFRPRRHSN